MQFQLRSSFSPFRSAANLLYSVFERALETAGLMLGADKARGYCLEMICADFLAGANLQEANSEALMLSIRRLLNMLSPQQRQSVLEKDGQRC